jgi:hypothetical protein
MTKELTSQERLDDWCDEIAREVRHAGRSGDGLEGFLEAYSLSRERVRKDCWDYLITCGGPNVWLRITPRRATVIGTWGTARYEKQVSMRPSTLNRAIAVAEELETLD